MKIMRRVLRGTGSIGWQLILPIVLVVAWWLWSLHSQNPYFPPLRDIMSSFARTWFGSGFTEDIVPSLRNFIVGYLIGVVVGVGVGVAVGRIGWLRWLLSPIIEYTRALPPPAVLPFAILILGVSARMQIGIIAFGSLFVVLLNTIDGVRGVDPQLYEVSAVYQLPRRLRLTRVILSAASPQIMVGLRNGLSLAVLLMMVSEMTAATQGIGFFTLQAQQNFAYVDMWSGMILLAIIGVVVNLLFAAFVERPLLFWQRGAAGAR